MQELEIESKDAVLIIRENMEIEFLVENDDEEIAPDNKLIIMAIASKLRSDAEWIKDLYTYIEEITNTRLH